MAIKAVVDPVVSGDDLEHADQRVTWSGRSWEDYEALDAMRGDSATPRLTYLDGELELMSPSRHHDGIEWWLGELLEAYMHALGVVYEGVTHWTLKQPGQVAVEPDGCWILGEREDATLPDLVLEVQWTRGGLAKLEIYRRLGVPEVWVWRKSALAIHVLTSTGYERRERSALLPGLDVARVLRYVDRRHTSSVLDEFRAELAQRDPRHPASG